MAEKRRGPGRPAYDSRQKLAAATCALLAERGYEATSPRMILNRAGVGQGSMYHHYRGKEDLALDAISHMRGRSVVFLESQFRNIPAMPSSDPAKRETGPEAQPEASAARIESSLTRLLDRQEGHALIRLLADSTAGAIRALAVATQRWCDELREAIIVGLRSDTSDDEIAEEAARLLAPEFNAIADALLTRALGHGLLHLPRWSDAAQ